MPARLMSATRMEVNHGIWRGPQIAAPCFIEVVTGNEPKLVHSTWFPRQSFHVCWHMSSNTDNKSIFGRVLLQALRRVKIIHGRSALLWVFFHSFWLPTELLTPHKTHSIDRKEKKETFCVNNLPFVPAINFLCDPIDAVSGREVSFPSMSIALLTKLCENTN